MQPTSAAAALAADGQRRWAGESPFRAMHTGRVLVGTSFILALLLGVSGCTRHDSGRHVAAEQHALGSFAVDSGTLAVCDPGYGPPETTESNGMHGRIAKAKPGDWRAFVTKVHAGEWGNRCSELMAHHVDHPPATDDAWEPASHAIGVDSGQAGIFDPRTMGVDSVVPQGYFGGDEPLVPDQLWYSMCCKQTLSDLGAGVVPGGAVSSSGFGDGAYEWRSRTSSDGSVVGVRIVFLAEADLK